MQEVEVKESKFECRKCHIEKDTSFFVKDSSRKLGHHPYCKDCQREIKNRNSKGNSKRASEWNKNNPEKRKGIRLKWYKNNPELTRIYRQERRLRENNLSDGSISKESLKQLPNLECPICKCSLDWNTKGSVHLDHIIPLTLGGKHSITNIRWTCATCNLKKGGRIA